MVVTQLPSNFITSHYEGYIDVERREYTLENIRKTRLILNASCQAEIDTQVLAVRDRSRNAK
jgi:hypothetical protein